jgi:hypothetical protein
MKTLLLTTLVILSFGALANEGVLGEQTSDCPFISQESSPKIVDSGSDVQDASPVRSASH